jgi:hypothetical protein
VYRTEALPKYEVAKKYKHFRDLHISYNAKKKGKGYHFKRVFGVYNMNSGGVCGRLSPDEKIIFTYKGYEDIYGVTRSEQAKGPFLDCVCKMYNFYMKTEEERTHFLKELTETYPELSEELKIIDENRRVL